MTRLDPQSAANQRDSRRRRRLAGDDDVGFVDVDRTHLQVNDASHLEDHDSRPFRFQCGAQRAGA
jgi:hypothetical protein